MRLLPALCAILAAAWLSPRAGAQEQSLAQPLPEASALTTGAALVPASTSTAPEPVGAGQQHYLNIKAEIGWPTALRLQGTVWERPNGTLVVEGMVGLDVFPTPLFVIAFPVYGVGCRSLYTKRVGGHDTFQLNPALELYAAGIDRLRWFIGPDVELCWLHDFVDHFGLEIGLNFGLGLGIAGKMEADRSSEGPAVLPVIGAFAGMRF